VTTLQTSLLVAIRLNYRKHAFSSELRSISFVTVAKVCTFDVVTVFDLLMPHKNTSVAASFRMNNYVVGLDFPKTGPVGR
jgi:hypothetical protein